MTTAHPYWLQPVNRYNAKIVIASGKPEIVMNEQPQSWESFWQGTLTGSIPSLLAGAVWLRGFLKDRVVQRDKLDEGFREYLINENMKLKQDIKTNSDKTELENQRLTKELEEMRHNFGLLQMEVGKTQQKVDKVEQVQKDQV